MSDSDLELLSKAARESGDIALRYFKKDPDVWDKDANQGPVTEADLAIDTMLRETLTRARPDYGWLSEETEDDLSRLTAERVFIVDPIDGTRAFIAGERTWTHSLAIAEHGRIIAAAVFAPVMERLWTAAADDPSRMNGEQISVSKTADLDGATVLAAKPSFDDRHWKGGTPALQRHFRPSLAYRLCLVAQGRFDAMLTLRDCWEWDIAAGALIVAQAGGAATEIAGGPLTFNSSKAKTAGCVASGHKLQDGLLARLHPLQS